MFPCCDLTYWKYLKDEPGMPVSQEHLDKVNNWLVANAKAEKRPDELCRCSCHVIGKNVMH